VEKVKIVPEGLKVKAKLDTGAQNSSLHAVRAEKFERQGEKWVRFDLTIVDEQVRVACYSEGPERIFQRSPGIIGKKLPTPDSLQ
jgi:hypothetical protein